MNGYSWQQIAAHCVANKHLFHGKDLEFRREYCRAARHYRRSPTPPQAKWLRDLFMRKFSGRI